jgi:hypothetical protein
LQKQVGFAADAMLLTKFLHSHGQPQNRAQPEMKTQEISKSQIDPHFISQNAVCLLQSLHHSTKSQAQKIDGRL